MWAVRLDIYGRVKLVNFIRTRAAAEAADAAAIVKEARTTVGFFQAFF